MFLFNENESHVFKDLNLPGGREIGDLGALYKETSNNNPLSKIPDPSSLSKAPHSTTSYAQSYTPDWAIY